MLIALIVALDLDAKSVYFFGFMDIDDHHQAFKSGAFN